MSNTHQNVVLDLPNRPTQGSLQPSNHQTKRSTPSNNPVPIHLTLFTALSALLSCTTVILSIPISGLPSHYLFFLFPPLTFINSVFLLFPPSKYGRAVPSLDAYTSNAHFVGQAAQIVGWTCGVVISVCEGVFEYVGRAPASGDDEEVETTMLWWGIAFASELVALMHVTLQCGLLVYCLVLRWRKQNQGGVGGVFLRRFTQAGSNRAQVQSTVLNPREGEFDEKTIKPNEEV
ncbi:uncharacterized protein STEHIDRAFT_170152 [Stereum hirsutum FP-91666 SS1]|uniref:uncharacterized protein n=1 Tax=Stereum hirsutum (strain FP-91666) TaxID=721885 RepID=UPI00044495B7|nr:uncharacterized protein STEHIDRAFT_170152 [Stereum hirsutum FP-91666 SS1]EIM84464.1 hypothetical protein STEHIDRAFT_170152 [Stereum hirsutum FP-91666 SS1]